MNAKDKQLEEEKILLKAIYEKETYIRSDNKNSTNFATTKSDLKFVGTIDKTKKKNVKTPKFKKCVCRNKASLRSKDVNECVTNVIKKKDILLVFRIAKILSIKEKL